MHRINDTTVELSEAEQIVGDFFVYLVEEKGMSPEAALRYLSAPNLAQALDHETIEYLLDRPATPLSTEYFAYTNWMEDYGYALRTEGFHAVLGALWMDVTWMFHRLTHGVFQRSRLAEQLAALDDHGN